MKTLDEFGEFECVECKRGFYCMGYDYVYPCPSGTYTNGTGATKIEHCIPCPIGHYCPRNKI